MPDISQDKDKLYRHYETRFQEHGYSYKTLGWGSEETQHLRFEVLADIADLTGRSVCDVGCGFGDLYPYLTSRYGKVAYHGIDLSQVLLDVGAKRHPDATFERRDILANPLPGGSYDYVMASGLLNFKQENHIDYLTKMVESLFSACSQGLAVNFLSSYVDYELEKDFHFSPEAGFALARRLTRWVTLRHNYPLYEFTLYLYRSPVPPRP